MANYKRKKKPPAKDQRTETENVADQLMAFERFRTEIAPELQQMLIKGATASEIFKKYENYAAARALSIAFTETDSGKAMSAIKDILDRTQGKAVERRKLEHSMANIDDKDLDALLASELDDLDALEAEYEEVDATEPEND